MHDYMDNIVISDHLDDVISNSIKKLKVEKRRKTIRNATIVGCLSVTLLGAGFCCTHTAYASKLPLIGSIFAKMENKTTYKGDMKTDAKQLVDEKDMVKLENNETIDNPYVQTSNGLTVSITEVNYDRTGLYLGVSIQSDSAFPKGFNWKKEMEDYVLSYNQFGVMGTCVLKDTGGRTFGETSVESLEGDFVDANTFVGMTQIDLSNLQYFPTPEEIEAAGIDVEMFRESEESIDDAAYFAEVKKAFPNAGEKIDVPDTFTCELTISHFYNEEYQKENVESEDRIVYYDGTWTYNLDVAFDSAKYQTVAVNNFDENGYGIGEVHKSSYSIIVDTELPSMGVDYFTVVCDANGDKLENQGHNAECYSIAGRDVSEVQVFVCDYELYMDELKGYYYSEDYEIKKQEKTFAQYLAEHAKYSATVKW